MSRGVIEVLHIQKGHDEVQIPDDPAEAKKKIDGLIQQRYSLFVNHGDATHKVSSYDEATNEWVVKESVQKEEEVRVAGTDPAAQTIEIDGLTHDVKHFDLEKKEYVVMRTVSETKETRIAAQGAKVTAVAPTAGG